MMMTTYALLLLCNFIFPLELKVSSRRLESHLTNSIFVCVPALVESTLNVHLFPAREDE